MITITHQRMIDKVGDVADEVWMMSGITKQQGQESLPGLGWLWDAGTGRNPGGWWTELWSAVVPFVEKVEIVVIDGPMSVSGAF